MKTQRPKDSQNYLEEEETQRFLLTIIVIKSIWYSCTSIYEWDRIKSPE